MYRFCFVLLCIRGKFPSTNPRAAYTWRGDLTEGFLRYEFGGLIFGGAYTWMRLIFGILWYYHNYHRKINGRATAGTVSYRKLQ